MAPRSMNSDNVINLFTVVDLKLSVFVAFLAILCTTHLWESYHAHSGCMAFTDITRDFKTSFCTEYVYHCLKLSGV